jgi:hypothetical protein
MCYYISIGVQQEQYELVRRLLSDKYDIHETRNPSFCDNLDSHETAFLLTRDGCSCNMFSGIDMESWLEDEISKRKKKGWSKTKIDRSIENMIEVTHFGLHRDIIQDISNLVRNIGSLTFAIHWYDSDVDEEKIDFLEVKKLSIGSLFEKPDSIKTDVVYKIYL